MQRRHPVKHSTSLCQRLNEEAQRRRKRGKRNSTGHRARTTPTQGAAGGQRLSDDRVAFISRLASTDVTVD
jgi:hypothetical protein